MESSRNFTENNFKCEICEKTFSTKQRKRQHIKTHEGQRNYKCDSCGKSFTTSGNLKIHINVVHEGQKDHKC